ncbi:MAG TPA: nuclear transport factor 2 family protein [Gemmatimonadales bacterium]|nr:nuclear transport factor 2 family protein [Gemmatimonadales bacterium]
MSHPNEEVIRAYVGAFARGDLDTAKTYLADDIVYHVGGRHPLAGDYRGKADVIGFFKMRSERTGGTFRIESHDLLANDTHGVALSKATVDRGGQQFRWNVITVYHVVGGKVTECWIHDSDQDLAGKALA